jgi:hypothetical protein
MRSTQANELISLSFGSVIYRIDLLKTFYSRETVFLWFFQIYVCILRLALTPSELKNMRKKHQEESFPG